MELRHLRYFVAVAEELHFGHAAARLHMAQPPLSQQIKTLETELGVQLFHRTKRKVDLTDAGRLFLPEARATLAQAGHAEEVARRAQRGEIGRLRLAFVTSAAQSVLPCIIRTFKTDHPGVDVELTELTPAQQVAALDEGRIDVAFLRPPIARPDLVIHTLLKEPLVVALPAGHPSAKQRQLKLRDLRNEPFVMFPRDHGPGLYDLVLSLCRAAQFSPHVAYEANQMHTILAYVAGGLGAALVPASLMELQQAGVSYRALSQPRAEVELAMVYPKRNDCSVLGRFIAAAEAASAEFRRRFSASVKRLLRA